MADPFSVLTDDAKAALLGVITTVTTNIIKNPTTTNVAAQGAIFVATLIPLLPTLESDAIMVLAQAAQTAATNALSPVQAPAA